MLMQRSFSKYFQPFLRMRRYMGVHLHNKARADTLNAEAESQRLITRPMSTALRTV
jgi:hypothetical protein